MQKITTQIICALICFALSALGIQAQDIHFSQNYATPLYINPAMTGLYNGDMRFTADYRSQWASLSSSVDAQTLTMSLDAKLIEGIGDGAWVSGGLLLYTDKEGFLGFSTNSADLAIAYNSPMGSKENYFSFGAMVGIAQRRIDWSQAQFGTQFDGSNYNPLIPANETVVENEQLSHINLSAGAMFYHIENSRSYFFVGGGAYNLAAPVFSFEDNEDVTLPMRMSIQAGGSIGILNRLDAVPGIYFMQQQKSLKTDLGSLFRFVFYQNIREDSFRAFNIGPYIRLAKHFEDAITLDALILALKVDYDDFSMGLSYDFNISQLNNATKGKGGPELSVVYTPKVRPDRLSPVSCPRF